jgi:hypothetical protein
MAQCYKAFYARNFQMFVVGLSVFSGWPFQPSLMFVSKTGAYMSEASFRYNTLGQAPGFTHKYWIKLERPDRENTCLLQVFVNYARKKLCNSGS